jgi:hypothetical protein
MDGQNVRQESEDVTVSQHHFVINLFPGEVAHLDCGTIMTDVRTHHIERLASRSDATVACIREDQLLFSIMAGDRVGDANFTITLNGTNHHAHVHLSVNVIEPTPQVLR